MESTLASESNVPKINGAIAPLHHPNVALIGGAKSQPLCGVLIELNIGSFPYSRFDLGFQLPCGRGFNPPWAKFMKNGNNH